MADQRFNVKYILIIAILAALVSGVILFYWWQIKAVATNMPQTVSPQNTVEVSKPLDTSDWKTYKDVTLGFEFRYPAEWAVKEGEKIEADNLFYIYDKTSCVGSCDNPSIQIRFGISENDSLLPFSAWVEREVKTVSVGNAGVDNSFVVDGSQGIKRVWRGSDNRLLAVFMAFPGENLKKIYYFLTAGQENSQILDQMLLNFRFLKK